MLDKQLELVKAAVEKKIIEERDDDRVEMVDDPPEHYGPTFEVGFDTNAVALNGTGLVVREIIQHWACVPAHDGNPEYLQKVRVKMLTVIFPNFYPTSENYGFLGQGSPADLSTGWLLKKLVRYLAELSCGQGVRQ